MFRFSRVCLLALGIVVSTIGASASAQDVKTPSQHDIPSARECMTTPVSLLSLLAMLNEVENTFSLGTVNASLVEVGTPLSDDDMAGIEWTTRQLVACANGGNPFQVIPLLSEQFQARLVVAVMDDGGIDTVIDHLPMLAAQTDELDGIPAIPITDAWYDPTSTKFIHAILEPPVEEAAQPPRFLVTYAINIDRWVIHDVLLIEE